MVCLWDFCYKWIWSTMGLSKALQSSVGLLFLWQRIWVLDGVYGNMGTTFVTWDPRAQCFLVVEYKCMTSLQDQDILF